MGGCITNDVNQELLGMNDILPLHSLLSCIHVTQKRLNAVPSLVHKSNFSIDSLDWLYPKILMRHNPTRHISVVSP